MKRINIILAMLLSAALAISCSEKPIDYSSWYGDGSGQGEADGGDDDDNDGEEADIPEGEFVLSAMSFNVRYAGAKEDTGEKDWSNRKKGVCAMINEKKPMIIGVQECLISQKDDITSGCPGYASYGLGRDDGNLSGETTTVFYNKSIFSLKEYGTFWLSPTPERPSYGWDAACKRTATWLKLEIKSSGQNLLFVNTHLDHQSGEAKSEGLKVIKQEIDEMNVAGLPVILTGDFNEASTSTIFNVLTSMANARNRAPLTDNFATSNGYGTQNVQIDHIYFTTADLEPQTYETIRDRWEGITYISDHYPIMATFKFKN